MTRQRRGGDDGFTLIELLVVIIIIGVLAAIAIPSFLNQRKKGYDATARSDLRNAASFEESYLYDNGVYADATALLAEGFKVSNNVTFTVVSGNGGATGYCLRGQHVSSNKAWYYNSLAGGLLPDGVSCT